MENQLLKEENDRLKEEIEQLKAKLAKLSNTYQIAIGELKAQKIANGNLYLHIGFQLILDHYLTEMKWIQYQNSKYFQEQYL